LPLLLELKAEPTLKVRRSVGRLCKTCACPEHNIWGSAGGASSRKSRKNYRESYSHYLYNLLKKLD
jgi:hypothetical protein